MDLKQRILREAERLDIDLIGFGNVERFELPGGNVPLRVLPSAKTVIGIGMQLLRGSLRGVEEGTNYSQYNSARQRLESQYLMDKSRKLALLLEDEGYVACPQHRYKQLSEDDAMQPDAYYREVRFHKDREPQMDFERSAVLCGLGELGMHGRLLSDEFGPLQVCAFLLTDADIESDPMVPSHLCDGCGECRMQCHGRYVYKERTHLERLDDETYCVYDFDPCQCALYMHGANRRKNPWLPEDALTGFPGHEQILRGERDLTNAESTRALRAIHAIYSPELPFTFDFPETTKISVHAQNQVLLCGHACNRACYVHLEKRNVLRNKYVNPFRRHPDWFLDD